MQQQLFLLWEEVATVAPIPILSPPAQCAERNDNVDHIFLTPSEDTGSDLDYMNLGLPIPKVQREMFEKISLL